MLYAGGDKSCVYSCLGHGDCERVCPVNAIKVNDKGIAEVDEDKCISCDYVKKHVLRKLSLCFLKIKKLQYFVLLKKKVLQLEKLVLQLV